jgi:hypothetical protein
VAARPWPASFQWVRERLGIAPRPDAAEEAERLLALGADPLAEILAAVEGVLTQIPPEVVDAFHQALSTVEDEGSPQVASASGSAAASTSASAAAAASVTPRP